jgi:uncharacterized membrane protein YdjX (TVP38/TMEM64 family)
MAAFVSALALPRRLKIAAKDWRQWSLWAAGGLVLLLLCLGWFLLPLRDWIDGLSSWLIGLGLWGATILILIVVVMTFLPLPDWPLPIAAGYVYGVWAFPMVYGGIAFASAIAFLGARYLGRDKIRALLARRPKYRALDKAVAKNGWQIVVLLRLSPVVPFNLQNYAFGVTGIPFLQYLGATLVGIVPGVAIYVYFGIFGKGLSGDSPDMLDWLFFGIGALATVALGVLVTRKTKAVFDSPRQPRRRRR